MKRPSGGKNESDDLVIPFNPSMFSPREGEVTGRGGGLSQPQIAVENTLNPDSKLTKIVSNI